MPWHIGSSDKCPASKPYAVIKDADDSVEGCHATREDAKKQLAALYANEPEVKSMEAEQISSTKWRVLAIPFGGPFKGGKDLDGEYFSPRTDIKADWFDRRPVMFHHGKDELIGDETLGTEDDLEVKKDGWWATVWLDRANRYWELVNGLLQAGKAYGSSGALGHVVKKAPDGELLVWPHIEQTITPVPINFLSRIEPAKALDAFNAAGISVDAYKALFEPDPDLAPDLPEGGEESARELLMARAALQAARLRTL